MIKGHTDTLAQEKNMSVAAITTRTSIVAAAKLESELFSIYKGNLVFGKGQGGMKEPSVRGIQNLRIDLMVESRTLTPTIDLPMQAVDPLRGKARDRRKWKTSGGEELPVASYGMDG